MCVSDYKRVVIKVRKQSAVEDIPLEYLRNGRPIDCYLIFYVNHASVSMILFSDRITSTNLVLVNRRFINFFFVNSHLRCTICDRCASDADEISVCVSVFENRFLAAKRNERWKTYKIRFSPLAGRRNAHMCAHSIYSTMTSEILAYMWGGCISSNQKSLTFFFCAKFEFLNTHSVGRFLIPLSVMPYVDLTRWNFFLSPLLLSNLLHTVSFIRSSGRPIVYFFCEIIAQKMCNMTRENAHMRTHTHTRAYSSAIERRGFEKKRQNKTWKITMHQHTQICHKQVDVLL